MLPVVVKPGAAATASCPPAGQSRHPAPRSMSPAVYVTSVCDADDAARYTAEREAAALERGDDDAAYFWHRLAQFAQAESEAIRGWGRR